jgi:hypothetical protein
MDYEEKVREYKDTFYKHLIHPSKDNRPEWDEAAGNRFEFLGREMFERFDFVTDGRTGFGMCYTEKLAVLEKDKEKIIEQLLDIEKKYGISPLYEGK